MNCAVRTGLFFPRPCGQPTTVACPSCSRPFCQEHRARDPQSPLCGPCFARANQTTRDYDPFRDRDSFGFAGGGGGGGGGTPSFEGGGGQFGGGGASGTWDDPAQQPFNDADYKAFDKMAASDKAAGKAGAKGSRSYDS